MEGVGGGHWDLSFQFPPIPSLALFISQENQFSEIAEGASQDLIILRPQAPGHLPDAQLLGSNANELEALPMGPGRGTEKGPQNGPFPALELSFQGCEMRGDVTS